MFSRDLSLFSNKFQLTPTGSELIKLFRILNRNKATKQTAIISINCLGLSNFKLYKKKSEILRTQLIFKGLVFGALHWLDPNCLIIHQVIYSLQLHLQVAHI